MSESKTGFRVSWISWLLLLAILGIIAAIAIPSYGDYVHRSQASEAVSLLGSTRTPLAEYFDAHRKWPERLDKFDTARSGKYTQSVAITQGAGGTGGIELTATMRSEGVDRRVAGQTIHLVSSDGGKNWTCKPGTMLAKNLSASCRN